MTNNDIMAYLMRINESVSLRLDSLTHCVDLVNARLTHRLNSLAHHVEMVIIIINMR